MTMTLTLNNQLVNATQFKLTGPNIPNAVRCTMTHDFTGLSKTTLTPVPKGLEVFGTTTLAVPVQNGQYHAMKENDWYLIRQGETQGIVLDDDTFNYVFKNELNG